MFRTLVPLPIEVCDRVATFLNRRFYATDAGWRGSCRSAFLESEAASRERIQQLLSTSHEGLDLKRRPTLRMREPTQWFVYEWLLRTAYDCTDCCTKVYTHVQNSAALDVHVQREAQLCEACFRNHADATECLACCRATLVSAEFIRACSSCSAVICEHCWCITQQFTFDTCEDCCVMHCGDCECECPM